MNRSGFFAGILGIFGAIVFFSAVFVSVATFKDGVYSPANCFVTELGLYTRGPGGLSALIFNLGLIVSGFVFGVFMIMYGIRKNREVFTATSFFGVISGVSLSAQGIFCLNYASYHNITLLIFLTSTLITCTFLIISELLFERKPAAYVHSLAAFLTGISCALFAGFVFTGGMAEIFYEDSKEVGRLEFIPFAAIEWIAYALLFVLLFVLSVNMIWGGEPKEKEEIVKEEKEAVKKAKENTQYLEL